jgi:hypothetical protein
VVGAPVDGPRHHAPSPSYGVVTSYVTSYYFTPKDKKS